MSLSRELRIDLMAYVDGELPEGDKPRIEGVLATSEEARAFVVSLGMVAQIVRAPSLPSSEVHPADSIADGVMARLGVDSVGKPEAAGAEKEASAPLVAKATGAEAPNPVLPLGGTARGSSPRERRARFMRWSTTMATGLALAATYFVFLRPAYLIRTHGPGKNAVVGAASEGPAGALAGAGIHEAEGNLTGVSVDQVDAPDHGVSVIYVGAGSESASSVVVWIDENSGSGGY